jgi:uncharacterized protein (TIGR02001 family)
MNTVTKIIPLAASMIIATLTAGSFNVRAAEMTGNVTLTSDYAFRGISQTEESAALQAGLSLTDTSGFYLTLWGSNVDFLTQGTLELDVMLGWSGAIRGDWSADIGVMRYGYPNSTIDGANFYEVYGSLSYQNLTVGLAYSDDYFANSGNFIYLHANYAYALTDNLTLELHLGQNEYNDNSASYMDWSVGLSTELFDTTLSLTYVDTDIKQLYLADKRIIIAIAKRF